MAIVKGLQPSNVYFFRIQPANGIASLSSEAIKTRRLGRLKRGACFNYYYYTLHFKVKLVK